MKCKCFWAVWAVLCCILTATPHSCAQSWILRQIPEEQIPGSDGTYWYFYAIASSADGMKLAAVAYGQGATDGGPIFTSADYGVTWQRTQAPNLSWNWVASSADGSKLVASGPGFTYISLDSGASWQQRTSVGGPVACSADFTKLVVAGGDNLQYSPVNIFHSEDSGATWPASVGPVGTNNWLAVASSADGTMLVAAGVNYRDGATPVFLSRDSGESWSPANLPQEYWSSVASSADGQKLVAVSSFGALDIPSQNYAPSSIYTSTDFGTSWTRQPGAPPEFWKSVASSADGTRLVVGGVNNGAKGEGRIYTSSDSGVTWLSVNDEPLRPNGKGFGWISVTSSADGNRLAALPNTVSGVYTLQLDSVLNIRLEVFPKTNQFFVCDDFQVVATVSNTTGLVVTDVAPVSAPTNAANGVVRALANADPTLPQTLPPHGTKTFTWPFRATHVGVAGLQGQFTGTAEGKTFFADALAQTLIRVLRPDLVVNMTGDQSAADPTDGCADSDPNTSGRQTTLRAAIETANALPGKDTILFDLPVNPPPSGGPTIILTKPLPPVTEDCEIRGTSQSGGGWVGIHGYDSPPGGGDTAGLELQGNVSITGLAFAGFTGSTAVWLSSGANTVQGCRFGLAADGVATAKNKVALLATASGQQIGGTGPAAGNEFRGSPSASSFGDKDPGTGILVTNALSAPALQGIVIEGNRFGPLDGSGSLKNGPGNSIVLLNASSCRIGGATAASRNYFIGSSWAAVFLVGAGTTDNDIVGNWFGLALDGSKIALSQFNGYGIALTAGAHHNRIGGAASGSGNVISGSDWAGVSISLGAHDNSLEGNWIGLTGDGTADASNEYGVILLDGADNRLGGSTPSQRNVISGNLDTGILVGRPDGMTFANKAQDPGTRIASGTLIQGNWIGLDHSGSRAIPNGRSFRTSKGMGIHIARFANGTLVGGNSAGVKNVISGNQGLGILVDATAATLHGILGNNVGVSVNGLTALPNQGGGIAVIGEPVAAIGGPGASPPMNLIAYNAGPGINLTQMKGGIPGLALDGNLIYNNAAFANILLSSPRTRNDKDDADIGPNGLQNWPLLLQAFNFNGMTEVLVDLSSFAAGVPVRVGIFHEAGGGGDQLLATANLTTRSQPKDRYVINVPLQTVGSTITALATTSDGTSEFSPPLAIVAGQDSDGDGIPDALEGQVPVTSVQNNLRAQGQAEPVPTLGDRNADGIADATQPNVTSAQVPGTDIWITVAAASGRSLANVVALRPLDVSPLAAPNEIWPGAVQFDLAGGSGTAEPIQLWFPVHPATLALWLATDTGWLALTNASYQSRGSLTSAAFELPAQPTGASWTVALSRARLAVEIRLLEVLPVAYEIVSPSTTGAVLSTSFDSAEPAPVIQDWIIPLRLALPENPTAWQLETSIDLKDWEAVETWPSAGATELDLAWPAGNGSRFLRWKSVYR